MDPLHELHHPMEAALVRTSLEEGPDNGAAPSDLFGLSNISPSFHDRHVLNFSLFLSISPLLVQLQVASISSIFICLLKL